MVKRGRETAGKQDAITNTVTWRRHNNWSMFHTGQTPFPSHHPTNSVEALKEMQSTDPNQAQTSNDLILSWSTKQKKEKERYLYSAIYTTYSLKALRHGSHTFYLQITPCLPFFRKRSTGGTRPLTKTSSCSLLLIYRPNGDERLDWPGWLTYSVWFTHINGHQSATGWVQDR